MIKFSELIPGGSQTQGEVVPARSNPSLSVGIGHTPRHSTGPLCLQVLAAQVPPETVVGTESEWTQSSVEGGSWWSIGQEEGRAEGFHSSLQNFTRLAFSISPSQMKAMIYQRFEYPILNYFLWNFIYLESLKLDTFVHFSFARQNKSLTFPLIAPMCIQAWDCCVK